MSNFDINPDNAFDIYSAFENNSTYCVSQKSFDILPLELFQCLTSISNATSGIKSNKPYHYFKKEVRKTRNMFQSLTSNFRMLPDFIIIGAQRCGTTSLYQYLISHPNIVSAVTKEISFFDKKFDMGLKWYKSHFHLGLYKKYIKNVHKIDVITGEATPEYFFHPHAPERIHKTIPDVRLIVMLRNPVDRAYSHYNHSVRHNIENLSFEEAIEKENQRIDGEFEKMLKDERYNSIILEKHSYLSRGIYINQIKRWHALFSKKQLMIIQSEQFYNDPKSTFNDVLEFLNLPRFELSEYKQFGHFNYNDFDKGLRKKLIEYFKPYNQKLYEYLGVYFDWDK